MVETHFNMASAGSSPMQLFANPASALVDTPAPHPTSSARSKGWVRPSCRQACSITRGWTGGREVAYPAAMSSVPKGFT